MFAARRFFHLADGAHFNLKIIAELAPDAGFDLRQARSVKTRSRQVMKLYAARFVLKKLHRVKVIKNRVVHVEGRSRNIAAGGADEKLLFSPVNIRIRGTV